MMRVIGIDMGIALPCAPLSPALPIELWDNILGEVVNDLVPTSTALSHLALVSHTFRIYANRARFASLAPYNIQKGYKKTLHRLDTLARIVEDGKTLERRMLGIAEFVTVFEMRVTGYPRRIMTVLDSRSLSYILDNIFRSTRWHGRGRANLRNGVRQSFALAVDPSRDARGGGPIPEIKWTMLATSLQQAINSLLLSTGINELKLVRIKEIPSTILRGSKIHHLYLEHATVDRQYFALGDQCLGFGKPLLLESLYVDNSVSFDDLSRLCYGGHTVQKPLTSTSLLSCLTSLTMASVNGPRCVEKMNIIMPEMPSLETLDIVLSAFDHDGSVWGPIRYGENRKLRKIRIQKNMFSPMTLVNALLGTDVPPSLKTIELAISHPLHCKVRSPARTAQALSEHDIAVFGEHLAQCCFDGLTKIVVGFNLETVAWGFWTVDDAEDREVIGECQRVCYEFLVNNTLLEKRSKELRVTLDVTAVPMYHLGEEDDDGEGTDWDDWDRHLDD